eukprot:364580-Chlamydomonas_euryale.AAC.1
MIYAQAVFLTSGGDGSLTLHTGRAHAGYGRGGRGLTGPAPRLDQQQDGVRREYGDSRQLFPPLPEQAQLAHCHERRTLTVRLRRGRFGDGESSSDIDSDGDDVGGDTARARAGRPADR